MKKILLLLIALPIISYADPGCNNSILTWQPVTGEVGYFVYWRDNSNEYDNTRRIYVGNTNGHPLDDFVPPPKEYVLLESGDKILLQIIGSLLMEYTCFITATALDDNGCESNYADEVIYYGGKPLVISW